jgi:hypothetical protein
MENSIFKQYLLCLLLLAINTAMFSQSPQSISYQAVIRDNSNNLLVEQMVTAQITILQNSPTGSPFYTELHTVSTNTNGLLTLSIGTGNSESNLSDINWQNGPFFIKTEIDPTGGNNYTITSNSQMLSVPYALYANTAGQTNETDPVFNAWDKNYLDLTNLPEAPNGSETVIVAGNNAIDVTGIGTSTDPYLLYVNQPSPVYGDIKSGLQLQDHNGWVLLDGRAISTLSSSQQALAGSLGFTQNLPDASNSVLMQNPSVLGSVSGTNQKIISQNQLPNITLNGTTDSNGQHSHTVNNIVMRTGQNTAGSLDNDGFDELDQINTETITTSVAGNHSHSFTTSSLNGGNIQEAIDVTPKSLNVNFFVFLGL